MCLCVQSVIRDASNNNGAHLHRKFMNLNEESVRNLMTTVLGAVMPSLSIT